MSELGNRTHNGNDLSYNITSFNPNFRRLNPDFHNFDNSCEAPCVEYRYIHIDSRQRDPTKDVNANSFRIYLNESYKNIVSMKLVHALIPKADYNIHENNNVIDIQELASDGVTINSTYTATIPIGNYSSGTLAAQLQTQLNSASTASGGGYTFTVSINNTIQGSDDKLRIGSSSGNFKLLFNSGDNADTVKSTGTTYSQANYVEKGTSARIPMGFNIEDVQNWETGTPAVLTTIVAPNKVALEGELYVLVDVRTSNNNEPVDVLEATDTVSDNKLFKVPFDRDMNFVKSYEDNHDMIKKWRIPIQISYMDIQIKTFYNDLYDFRGHEYSMTLEVGMLTGQINDHIRGGC